VTWNTVLEPYRVGSPPLLDSAFIARYDGRTWTPASDDRHAAAKLHTQLASRISTQRLPYLDGIEKTALDSLYSLFETTRQIAEKHPEGYHFDAIVWHVLNTHLRPFTRKWHRESVRGSLSALDATDQFRADLRVLQGVLVELDRLLLHLRDGAAPAATAEIGSPLERAIQEEMKSTVVCKIRSIFSGMIDAGSRETKERINEINEAEKTAIAERRAHYQIDADSRTGAAALALSGGGIRSATFSLGVLIALAERGLLPQFDYMSTVSGGGYLGSFLSVFLQSKHNDVGLNLDQLPFRRTEGEAVALRHIRHHSKFLTVGSVWERLKMLSAQLIGMALNGLAVGWVILVFVLIGHQVGTVMPAATVLLRYSLGVLGLGALTWLVLLRFRIHPRRVDNIILVPAAAVVICASWILLVDPPTWLANTIASVQILQSKPFWVAVLGAAPAVAPLVSAIAPRLFARVGAVLTTLSVLAAPLFLVVLCLYIRDLIAETTWGWTYLGVFAPLPLVIAIGGALIYLLLFDINMTSPHRHYRRKLAEAYLIQPRSDTVTEPKQEATGWVSWLGKLVNTQPRTRTATEFNQDVALRVSQLKSQKAPYHLINCALNVPASKNSNMQGRLTDFFMFSRAYSGSPVLGYFPTRVWEGLDPDLNVGTAMAISGAAASPQMGTGTIARARFWLALLNVRLGYWVRHPKRDSLLGSRPGVGYLLREMVGWMDERSPFINLSDGGHIENLAIYELFRRRCKFIVAIDGEQDARMTFHGLTTLQRMAAIDLGVQLDLDLDDLRLNEQGLSRSHFRFCRIRYPQGERGSLDDFGYLLYVKLSLTGNEGEFLRRYRLDEPAFPHHSTADQFFSEAQFEAYRSLGEHVGNKLFLDAIVGPLATERNVDLEAWFVALGKSLLTPADRQR
jgi:hypothetical protein